MQLESAFPEASFGDVPLFPDAAGGVIEKHRVVESFEAVARRLGLATTDSQGNRAFGGHSLRVTGARWLASRGMPLSVIQLIARWDSNIVARYVGEAPLETVTSLYRSSVAGASLDELLEARLAAARDLDSELGSLRFSLTAALQEVSDLRASRADIGPARPVFVTSGGGTVHVVATRLLSHTPSFEWRAACGWRFGLTPHTLSDAAPSGTLCQKCAKHTPSPEVGP